MNSNGWLAWVKTRATENTQAMTYQNMDSNNLTITLIMSTKVTVLP